jgi:glycosyltransferase involved in cell wall biosynthesis
MAVLGAVNVFRGLDLRLGGTSVSIPALAQATDETGRINNQLAVFRPSGDRRDVEQTGIPANRVVEIPWEPHSPARIVEAYGKLREIIGQVNVAHFHGLWQFQFGAGTHLCRSIGTPYVVSVHGMLDKWALRNKSWKKRPYSMLLERPKLRRAACLRALTKDEVWDYRAFGLNNPIAIIPNGVSIPAHISPDAFFQKWPKLKGKRIVLFLSRLHYKKGLDILCRAWRSLAGLADDIHLVLAGPDYENTQAETESFIQSERLTNSVSFVGMLDVEMKWSALAAATLFVLPSYSEGFSMSVLEGLAAARPVVISRQCNFMDLKGKEFAAVIETDANELHEALISFLRLPSRDLQARGDAARAYAAKNYNWQRIGEMMADVYEWMLGGDLPRSTEMFMPTCTSVGQAA